MEKILYVGVSPKPYYGCNYWYVDESGKTQAKTYVWARMGKRDIKQLVYVDSVRWCDLNEAPYPYDRAKRILGQATEEESAIAEKEWKAWR